jgi:hypothetical protein
MQDARQHKGATTHPNCSISQYRRNNKTTKTSDFSTTQSSRTQQTQQNTAGHSIIGVSGVLSYANEKGEHFHVVEVRAYYLFERAMCLKLGCVFCYDVQCDLGFAVLVVTCRAAYFSHAMLFYAVRKFMLCYKCISSTLC